ncbi:MAG TPA: ABC transporter permease [Treponema sp.]|uniref:ABC transporter permease n=1 Tax=Gracilinema caldarium TaxID=215591 RepID=UPI0026F1AC1E|nr:FtsX-like permease family protein [Gracilinema caldarium]HON14642.1 ABC transporter permease [Treponema sp.]HPC71163.1 ABC transporter permease [Treponema sp.]HRS04983.1 ABC transporter permease [Treponema sp.]
MSSLISMAFRNLSRQKRRSFLLGGAIAFGIMIVTIISSLAGGLMGNVAANIAHLFAGHVFIEGVEKSPSGKNLEIIRNDMVINDTIQAAGLSDAYIQKRSGAAVTLIFEGKKTQQSIIGVDFDKERLLRERVSFIKGGFDQATAPNSLFVSEQVAKKLKVDVGDRLLAQTKTVTGQFNVGEFRVAGIMPSMGLFDQMLAYTPKAYLNSLIGLGPEDYQMLGIMLPDLTQAEKVAENVKTALKARAQVFELPPGTLINASNPAQSRYQKLAQLARKETWEGTKYRVYTINDTISQIEQVVQILNTVSTVILVVLFLIILVGILNTFRIIIYERTKEIGTMRALGLQRPDVRNLFILEATFLAIGGVIAGFAAAGIVMLLLSFINFGTGTFFALFMKNGHLSFVPQLSQSSFHVILVVLLTMLAAYLPARRAAKLEPADALRTSK